MEVNLSVADVGTKIGGKVQDNIKAGIFLNACPLRMSYVLNQMGVPIPSRPYAGILVVKGTGNALADGVILATWAFFLGPLARAIGQRRLAGFLMAVGAVVACPVYLTLPLVLVFSSPGRS